jgi:hypothetical protein
MPNVRMFPPPSGAFQNTTVNGRSYAASPGSKLDVPEQDAHQLEANGWIRGAYVGPTSGRPNVGMGVFVAQRGSRYFDTTVGAMIEFDGATWRSLVDGSAV